MGVIAIKESRVESVLSDLNLQYMRYHMNKHKNIHVKILARQFPARGATSVKKNLFLKK